MLKRHSSKMFSQGLYDLQCEMPYINQKIFLKSTNFDQINQIIYQKVEPWHPP